MRFRRPTASWPVSTIRMSTRSRELRTSLSKSPRPTRSSKIRKSGKNTILWDPTGKLDKILLRRQAGSREPLLSSAGLTKDRASLILAAFVAVAASVISLKRFSVAALVAALVSLGEPEQKP